MTGDLYLQPTQRSCSGHAQCAFSFLPYFPFLTYYFRLVPVYVVLCVPFALSAVKTSLLLMLAVELHLTLILLASVVV